MLNKPQVHVIAGITVLVFAAGIILSGGEVESSWLRFYAYAATFGVVALTLWNRWIWRLRLAQRFKSVPCDLNGTWKGTLETQWKDPATGASPPAKPAYLVVRQTASSMSVTMLTDEMRSRSSLASVSAAEDGTSLNYIYLSRPDSRVEHRSRMHPGATSLDVTGRPATRLKGRYWTDRDSRGELDFVDRVAKHVDDYDSAESLFVQHD
jgi:hypothetical protein